MNPELKMMTIITILAVVICTGFVTTCVVHEQNSTERTRVLMRVNATQDAANEAYDPITDSTKLVPQK